MFSIPKNIRDRKQERRAATEYRRTELIQELHRERDDALFMAKIRQARIDSLEEQLRFAKAHVERMQKLTKKTAVSPERSGRVVRCEIDAATDSDDPAMQSEHWYQGEVIVEHCVKKQHVVAIRLSCDCK